MTTRKKKNKLRDNTLASLEKFNTTKKRNIMKGGDTYDNIIDTTILSIVGTIADLEDKNTEIPTVKLGDISKLQAKCESLREEFNKLRKDNKEFNIDVDVDVDGIVNNIVGMLNTLLDNKRKLSVYEKQFKKQIELQKDITLFDSLTATIQNYINLINDIMTALKEKFSKNMKYQWIEIVSLSDEDKKTIIDMQYKKGNYNKKTAIIDKLYKSSNNGMWTFDVWIPDKDGKTISLADKEGRNELDKKLKVKTISGKIIDTFVTEPIILYSCRFLEKKYNIEDEVNYQPVIKDANDKSLAHEGFFEYEKLKGRTYTETFRSYGRGINSSSKRSLREELKKYIGSIIYTEITDKKDPDKKEDINLLKRSLRFEDTKQDIRTILVNKISKIFADGETRFNLFNKENLKRNFAEDDKDDKGQEGEQEAQARGEREGGLEGGGVGEEQEGGGAFGFRNFDKDDARNFIKFILANLKALLAECNGFKKNIQDLLLTTYLKTLFSKIGPAELNKLLPDIENIKEASEHIIGHFFDRLLNRNATSKESVVEQSDKSIATHAEDIPEEHHQADAILKRSDDEHSAETSIRHAAAISQLNFQLKSNVKSFMAAIVDISLHTDELIGTKEKLANYLDNEYDKAMNIPFGLDKRRIENLEINNALREILGRGLNSIKGFRTQITRIDEHIDSITEKNIDDKMKQLIKFGLLHNIELGDDSFTYKLPDKFKNILKQNQDTLHAEEDKEQSAKIELEVIKTLVKEIGMLDQASKTLTDNQTLKLEKLINVVIPSAAKPTAESLADKPTAESLADKPATMADKLAESLAPAAAPFPESP